MEVNPFSPPRSSDVEGAPAGDAGAREVPEEAVRQLADSAPWARWAARLMAVSLVVGVAGALVAVPSISAAETAGRMFGLVIGMPVGILFLVLTRRYATHAQALSQNDRRAMEGIAQAQGHLFTAGGILMIIVLSLAILGFIVGLLAGRR